MKVSEGRSRVCKAVTKAKGSYFEEAKRENIVILHFLYSLRHSQYVATIEKVVKVEKNHWMEKTPDWQCECWCLFVCFLMLTVVSTRASSLLTCLFTLMVDGRRLACRSSECSRTFRERTNGRRGKRIVFRGQSSVTTASTSRSLHA